MLEKSSSAVALKYELCLHALLHILHVLIVCADTLSGSSAAQAPGNRAAAV